MVEITNDSKNKFYFDLKRKLNEHLNGDKKHIALDHTSETDIQSSSGANKLKIALHMDPFSSFNADSRIVTLRSLTNPSVAVRFDAISPEKSNFSPDDKLFTALDFIFRLVPQDFNSIDTHSKPQEGDINISLGDHEEVMPYQNTKNESDELVSNSADINGLSISKAPK